MSDIRAAPQTHSQPSRKGKKAWRKNVDLTQLTQGLSAARDEEIVTGKKAVDIAAVSADELFQLDVDGSEQVRRKARKAHGALKADQILAQRSAVPAVSSRKRPNDGLVTDGVMEKRVKKSGGISMHELQRLKNVAYGGEKMRQDVVTVDRQAAYDPWADQPEPAEDPNLTFVDKKQPKRAPESLREAPIALTKTGKPIPNVRLPNAGRSYNPAFNDWTQLLAREGDKEVAAERKRLQDAEAEAARMERVEEARREAEKTEKMIENGEDWQSEYESEWEGIQSDYEDAHLSKKRPERKTPAERNKVKRRKRAEQLARHEARMQERERQAKKIDELRQAVEVKEKARDEVMKQVQELGAQFEEEDSEGEKELKRGAKKRNKVPQAPLEVVLPEELQDSLRRLKPEGSLLTDRYRTMVIQGKTEARKPAPMHRQAKTKATEKWSYKDWRLPSQGRRSVA